MPSSARIWARRDRVGDVRLAGRALLARRGRRPRGRTPRRPGSRSAPGCAPRGSRRRAGAERSRSGPGAWRPRTRRRRAPARPARLGRGRFAAGVVFGAGVVVAIGAKDTLSRYPARCERGLGLGTLVPRRRPVGPDDRALVALAGEEHDVARPGALDGRVDRRAPVGDDEQVVVAPLAGRLRARARSRRGSRSDPRRADPRRSRPRSGRARRRSGPSPAAWRCRVRRPTRRPR